MKTILTILAFTMLCNVSAQEKNVHQKKHQFTPEQIAELQTKQLELSYELNEKQRKELYALNYELAKKRQQNRKEMYALKLENKTLSSDEKYQKELNRLDEQKKHQTEMKRILGEKQYLNWKETYQNKRMNVQHINRNKIFAEKKCKKNCRLNN